MLTTAAQDGAGQLRFSLFGVPVRIDPSFLILLVIVALPAIGEGPGYAGGLAVIVFASILGHELGHATAVQALVEPNPSIVLYGLGGLTSHQRTSSRPRSLIVSLAGPAAGLLVGVVVLLAGRAIGGPAEDMGDVGWQLAVFWTIANLLPVLPLDGGHALEHALPGGAAVRHRVVLIVSVVTCAAGALVAWGWGDPILVVFAAWFGVTNLSELRSARGSARPNAATADDLQRLQEGFSQLRPETAETLEAEARAALSHAPEEARSYAGSALVAALLVQEKYEEAADLVRGLGPEGCAHGFVQLVDLGADAGPVLEARLQSRSSAYDATLYLLDRSLHHDWQRAAALVEERPPESFEAAWLELATSWAFHAGAFEAAASLGRVLEARVNAPAASYNVACAAARASDVTGGIAALDRAVARGWDDLAQLDADDDLAALHASPEWERIRREVKARRPSGGQSNRRWGAAAGLLATLALAGLSVRLASVAEEPTERASAPRLDISTDVVARDPGTGEERWRQSGSSMFPSWVGDDLVLVEEVGAGTRALDARTGEERWRADVSGAPLVGEAVVVLDQYEGEEKPDAEGDFAPHVTVLDRATGDVLWARDDTAVTVSGDVVVLNKALGGETVGVDAATGADRWSVPGDVAGVQDVGASTLVVKDAERLTGVDPGTGDTRWTTQGEVVGTTETAAWVRRAGDPRIQRVELDTGEVTPIDGLENVRSVVGDAGGIAVLSDGSRHWGVDERSGAIRWELEAEASDAVVPMVIGDGLAVEASTNEVVAIDLQTGEVRWRAEVDDVFYAQIESGVVVASTPDGSIVLDPATGEESWSLGDVGVAFGSDDLLVSVQLDA
jgi:outer membrane protein assembly factor BamB/Zn-dependent protease